MRIRSVLSGLLGLAVAAHALAAQPPSPSSAAAPASSTAAPASAAADGAIAFPAASVPFSSYASPEALTRFRQILVEGKQAPDFSKGIEPARKFYDAINANRVERMKKLYKVKLSTSVIAGVATDVVEPADGVARDNKYRVLINLHGGGFLWGAHSGALVEAIPVAAVGRIKVISIDYRQGPDHTFPAASDDVEAVYKELLKTHPAANIGIYGCSAGGILTGEVVARLIHDGIKVPGAIGMFCSAIVSLAGDSSYVSPVLSGDPIGKGPVSIHILPYFAGANETDPLVLPANDPAMLKKFPPTLLISGTRDFAMSSLLQSQRLLTQAGVEVDLHLWDGMWHSFFSDPELPESKEAYAVMAAFFDKHLAKN
ncbi:alpha/beta hydrolase [Pinirhizobacter soli]|uniref:alpha/beta hydrolase n=1 Tax=Pinirhizobacter soli TaxID=2786953 RepID=UPI002029FE75|nr:alpha/beta hydrolase [Pinirhizobacter soli]